METGRHRDREKRRHGDMERGRDGDKETRRNGGMVRRRCIMYYFTDSVLRVNHQIVDFHVHSLIIHL